ncbi:MAG: cation diffusion facilitator family transporter [Flavobacteriaceae bacterium]|nr:cation diffusion facilitator family transporter [Flavobacteriaceae bacterium]
MGHHHTHQNHGKNDTKGRNLVVSIFLNIIITASQVVGGFWSGSLALLSDALHNFSDVLSLIISYIAVKLSRNKASYGKTFGYKRAEIIAAFINASSLVIVAIFLIIEAYKRFISPVEVAADLVIWFSLLGIVANGFSVLLLKKDANDNMNMKSAYIHLFSDMLASVAVLIGGLLMRYFSLFWIDPLLTLIIALYLVYMGYDLIVDATRILMLFTPSYINLKALQADVSDISPVKNLHHLHVWQLNEVEVHLEAHIEFYKNLNLKEFDTVLVQIESLLLDKYGINHVTLQPEFEKEDSKNPIIQD